MLVWYSLYLKLTRRVREFWITLEIADLGISGSIRDPDQDAGFRPMASYLLSNTWI